MGDPRRRFKKKYETPFKPWDPELLKEELTLVGEYGLKNKRELRRFVTMLKKIRRIAKSTFTMRPEIREEVITQLIKKLHTLGILDENATVNDILQLTVRSLLERRLQTIVYRKGLAKSIHHARQMIVHRHIMIGDRIVDRPGYLVKREEEPLVRLNPRSPYARATN
ncbi:MAG: 30S ribosomal protein S4 [Candidatus Geothermarchaeota archaeon]